MESSYIDNLKMQYFPSKIWEARPLGEVSLRQFIDSHKKPKPEIAEVFRKIKEAAKIGDLKTKDTLKQNHLFSFVPSVKLDGKGRCYENVIGFNPIMVVEFDKISHAEELKVDLFKRLKCIVAAYISPSRRGVKFLVRIPIPKSIEDYKAYWCGLAYHLSKFEGFDPANFNAVLPMFLSYDTEILVREDAEEWTERGGKEDSFKPFVGEFTPPENLTKQDTQEVVGLITYLINKIEDNGHYQVIAASSLLGGFVAGGYVEFDDGLELLYELIESNSYLSKNIKGYKKTAQTMLQKGMNGPLLLDKHKAL
jgi:hypothetical protein